jgi:catechol 2,3-dioxygenase-like lactoylglutathione lyase family enzyme
MHVIRGHHFSFTVSDLERSKAFYGDLLGLEEVERPDFGIPGVWYGVGETQIHLIGKPEGVDTGSPSPKLTPIANHSAFQIEDYDAAVDRLRETGAEFIELSREVGQIFVRDPDGNIIELIQAGGRLGPLPKDVMDKLKAL